VPSGWVIVFEFILNGCPRLNHARLKTSGYTIKSQTILPAMPTMSVVERVAEKSGYESLPAFSQAFKRHFGIAPGSFDADRYLFVF